MSAAHWPQVARIYMAGINSGNATFEREAPSWERWCEAKGGMPCLVAHDGGGSVLGWAALTPSSLRTVYQGVGAVSVYVDPAHARQRVGKTLLLGLIDAAEQAGIWTVEAGIFPENAASIALHKGCGFRLVGVRRRVGQMPDGRWRDVCLYERRSKVVGVG